MEAMNAEERKAFDKMENTVEQIQQDVNEIKMALLGNPMSNDKGFKGQIDKLYSEIDLLKNEIKILREERVENKVYVLIIKGLLGIFGAALVTYLFTK